MKLVLLMAMVLASCGDDRCEPGDLDGSYLVTYTRESGTCADISPVIVQYDNGRSVEDPDDIVDCIQLYSNFSADACELNESYTCTLMDEGIIVDTKLHQERIPYYYGSYIKDPSGFYGRAKEKDTVLRFSMA